MQEQLKERIKFNMEWIKIFMLIIVTDITGILSVINNGHISTNMFRLIISGILLSLALIVLVLWLTFSTKEIIKKL